MMTALHKPSHGKARYTCLPKEHRDDVAGSARESAQKSMVFLCVFCALHI